MWKRWERNSEKNVRDTNVPRDKKGRSRARD
jgi:hypothetical protein